MLDGIYYAYATALFLLCVGYILGYVVGRLDLIWRAFSSFQKVERAGVSGFANHERPRDFLARDAEDRAKEKIEIDERKYVSAISTDGFVKNEKTTLGKTTASDDDIGASVSKLAQLKGK